MGLLMCGTKERREQEKQAQAKHAISNDPTAAGRSAIRRRPTIRLQQQSAAERRNGNSSRSVRLSLRNYDVDERDGEVVFARRPPAVRSSDTTPAPSRDSRSRRTHRADVEDTNRRPGSRHTSSAQTLADLAAMDRALPPSARRWLVEGSGRDTGFQRFDRLRELMAIYTNGNESQDQRSRDGNIESRPGDDTYLPRSSAMLSELEDMRRNALGLQQAMSSSPRDAASGARQIPAYGELAVDARRELDQIMGTVPPPPRVDGLGDRVRSPSPGSEIERQEDAWETLLTTITPDEQLPSAESSFNTAAAESVTSSLPGLTGQRRSLSSSGAGRGTAESNPVLVDGPMPASRRSGRLTSPGCEDDDDTGMATPPDSLPELRRVARVESPALSVRPDHVQGDGIRPHRFQAIMNQIDALRQHNPDNEQSESETATAHHFTSRLNELERHSQAIDSAIDSIAGGVGTPVSPPSGSSERSQSQENRSWDEARRGVAREIEEYSRSRYQQLLANFMARGDTESVPDELWQAFVPRNVLAGAAGEEMSQRS